MSKIKFALLGLLLLALTACPQVSSLDAATVDQINPFWVRITTKVPGLLTVYSTQPISTISGSDLETCEITSALGKTDQGVICKSVPAKFIINLETLGKVNARVTN